jgi:hypothetical protein
MDAAMSVCISYFIFPHSLFCACAAENANRIMGINNLNASLASE